MIFTAEQIAHLSTRITLQPGMILTATPRAVWVPLPESARRSGSGSRTSASCATR